MGVGGQMTRVHSLKAWSEYWDAIDSGDKTFEVRWDDRGYKVGDVLELWRYDPGEEMYTDTKPIRRTVSFILRGDINLSFGIASDYVVMGLRVDGGGGD